MRSAELIEFYHSHKWERTRTALLASRNWICERCGRPATVAHHRIHLNESNVNDPQVAYSFSNLEALCRACHVLAHKGKCTREGLSFTSDGKLVETPSSRRDGR